jgi:secondary thiamine-phosphate synthase enzyme
MNTKVISVATGSKEAVHDITGECLSFLREIGASDGLLNLFVPHATAGIALIELGSGSDEDLLSSLGEMLPADDRWAHAHGSRGHGRSHVMPAFIAPYATIPVIDGEPALGTWQSVAVVDLNVDNVVRKVRLSFITGS